MYERYGGRSEESAVRDFLFTSMGRPIVDCHTFMHVPLSNLYYLLLSSNTFSVIVYLLDPVAFMHVSHF